MVDAPSGWSTPSRSFLKIGSQGGEPIFVALPPGLHHAEPAARHQAVPEGCFPHTCGAVRAGCQPAAGAGCQPVDPAPVAAGPRPAPQAPPTVFGRSAVAPGSVDLLNPAPSEAADAAGTDVGCSLTSTSIVDGMQALRDGMGALEAALTAMAPTMATKDDMVALKTAMETGFDKMSKRLDDMEEKVQSLQHGWKVVPEGAAEGAAEDHGGEASGPVCAHSMDAGGATTVASSSPKRKTRPTRRGRGRRNRLLLDGDEGEANETQ